ncbi:hypothetical protein BV375_00975 [Nostoc sp. 106C]|nr:hypothetical protein BV375_00975 [Nostoc sp. 106C]
MLQMKHLPKKGRGQKEENIIFALCQKGLEQINLFMKKEKIYIPSSRRKKYYVPIESRKFIYKVSLLPPASCLLNLIQVTFKRSIKLKTSSL